MPVQYTEYIETLKKALNETKMTEFDGKDELRMADCMDKLIGFLRTAKKNRQRIFFAGNGGSAAIAIHMTMDFMKNGGMRTVSLYDNALMTGMGNDYGFEYIFSRPLERLADPGDILVTVSSSGNSPDIVSALQTGRDKNMKILTFSGFRPDNASRSMGDFNIYVPLEHYGIVETIHILLLQQMVDTILEMDGLEP